MTSFVRWVTFNFVGAVGMVVQLAALAFFNRLLHGRYLIATVAALEITLLHNFVWHTQCTWRDRRDGFSRWRQLLRFHLSNGLLSLAGNIALMRLLVHVAHLPVILANAIAVLCCSLANFWFSHRWTFSAPKRPSGETQAALNNTASRPVLALALIAMIACSEARAQLPDAPSVYQQLTMPTRANTPRPPESSDSGVRSSLDESLCNKQKCARVPTRVWCRVSTSRPVWRLECEGGRSLRRVSC